MTNSDSPAIPAWLAHRPTVGGVVVPWITPRTADGRYLLGMLEQTLAEEAIRRRLCGVCGLPLTGQPLVLLMRMSDLPSRCTNEPALHPQCAAYTAAACPMVSGRLTHYRSLPPKLDAHRTLDPQSVHRQGAPAEPWFAVWVKEYRVVTFHGNLAASYAEHGPLRIRGISAPWSLLLS
ncbi:MULTISPECIES: hypothetical protein [unclassified Crossiella]|uniref:hypothetical protein n=1 Tax=unclassified Crossiella TaxID=2620835 RepID=UPI001FFFFABB|nr:MULTISPECIES: hypothetical protein [unclassified Crossiella]MCK2240028.1 hypothetical protein [Crossiella sp. S99.2]MCK2252736.1 hypothetical protein [Crossiella sp. S99.1]